MIAPYIHKVVHNFLLYMVRDITHLLAYNHTQKCSSQSIRMSFVIFCFNLFMCVLVVTFNKKIDSCSELLSNTPQKRGCRLLPPHLMECCYL